MKINDEPDGLTYGLACLAVIILIPVMLGCEATALYYVWNQVVVPIWHPITLTWWQALLTALGINIIGGAFAARAKS